MLKYSGMQIKSEKILINNAGQETAVSGDICAERLKIQGSLIQRKKQKRRTRLKVRLCVGGSDRGLRF